MYLSKHLTPQGATITGILRGYYGLVPTGQKVEILSKEEAGVLFQAVYQCGTRHTWHYHGAALPVVAEGELFDEFALWDWVRDLADEQRVELMERAVDAGGVAPGKIASSLLRTRREEIARNGHCPANWPMSYISYLVGSAKNSWSDWREQ